MRTRDLTLAASLAALYVAIGFLLQPIAFGQVQVRVADALYPLIAVLSWPALIGLTIGHLMFNITSPLGILDIVSVALFIPAKLAIQRWGFKAVPLHIISIALWVPFMLWHLFGVPFWLTVLFVGVGETIAEIGLGYPVYLGVKRWMGS